MSSKIMLRLKAFMAGKFHIVVFWGVTQCIQVGGLQPFVSTLKMKADYAVSCEAAPHTVMSTVFHAFTPLSLVYSCCISLQAIISYATYSALSQMKPFPMKCYDLSNKMHSITSQKTVIFII